MPLATEIDLCQGDIVLDGGPSSPPHGKGHSSPHFSTHFALARSSISATAGLLFDTLYLPVIL